MVKNFRKSLMFSLKSLAFPIQVPTFHIVDFLKPQILHDFGSFSTSYPTSAIKIDRLVLIQFHNTLLKISIGYANVLRIFEMAFVEFLHSPHVHQLMWIIVIDRILYLLGRNNLYPLC